MSCALTVQSQLTVLVRRYDRAMQGFLLVMGLASAGLALEATSMVDTIKSFGNEIDSSCIILLHTPSQLQRDSRGIMRLVKAIASEVSVDISITSMSFGRFLEVFHSNLKYVITDCKSPIIAVIHEDPETQKEVVKVTNSVTMQMLTWIVYGIADIDTWFKDMDIPFSCVFIAAREINSSFVALHELYRVTRDRPLRSPLYGNWTTNGYYIPNSIIYNRRYNLEGMLLRTGSTQNKPIHSFQPQANGELELVGYFPEIWMQLEEILNFTSVHFPSADNVTGIKEKNGRWNGLIGMLLADQIDVAVSEFIMDSQRSHVVDFSRPLVKTSYQIFFKSVGDNYNWAAILRPFHIEIWLAILAWVMAGSCALAFAHNQGCRRALETHAHPGDFSLINAIFFHVKTICSQGHNVIPSMIPCRILFITAYGAACILAPSYSAYLISYLTFRTPKRPFDNLQGLLEDGSYKLQTNSKTAEYTYFSEATHPTLQRIYRELIVKIPEEDLPLNTEDALDRVCRDPHLAHFGDMAVAHSYVQDAKLHKQCNIVTLSQSISTIFSSMALRQHSPYRMVINHYLQRMEDHGIIDRTHDATFPSDKSFTYPSTSYVELNDVAATFILLLIGTCLALTILLIENFYWRWTQRNRPIAPKYEAYRPRPPHLRNKGQLFLAFVN